MVIRKMMVFFVVCATIGSLAIIVVVNAFVLDCVMSKRKEKNKALGNYQPKQRDEEGYAYY